MPTRENVLESNLKRFPLVSDRLRAIFSSSNFHGVISAADATYLSQRMGIKIEQLAIDLVPFAQSYAVAPISNFQVGAVGVGLTGALYYGANLEIAGEALSFTVHAEQACVANAWVNGEQGLATLAISAAPCGYCRQFLYELVDVSSLMIALPSQPLQPLTYYLPDPFGPHDLGLQGGLMQTQNNGLVVGQPLDATGTAALAAANASYSPYTKTFAGVALTTSAGVTCTGRYAENAAYNPSMSPLEAALSQLIFYNQPFGSIIKATLVEADGLASQAGATQTILGAITNVHLDILFASAIT